MTTTPRTRKPLTPAQERRNEIVRAWLAFSGVSISELGRRVSGQPNAVKDILSGKIANPTQRTLQAIARHVGVPVDHLTNPELPPPQFGFGPHACGHALIRIPEAVVARNHQQELDFVPFPGNGLELRLQDAEHLSMAGAGALRAWKIWHEVDVWGSTAPHCCIVDISCRGADQSDATYVVVEFKAEIAIRSGRDLRGHERIIGRVVRRCALH
jgi:hypothetical protein